MHRILFAAAALLVALDAAADDVPRLREATDSLLRSLLPDDGEAVFDYRIEMAEGSDGAVVATVLDPVISGGDRRLVFDDMAVVYVPEDDMRWRASTPIPSFRVLSKGGAPEAAFTARGTLTCLLDIDLAFCERGTIDGTDLLLADAGERTSYLAAERVSGETVLDAGTPDSRSSRMEVVFGGVSLVTPDTGAVIVRDMLLTAAGLEAGPEIAELEGSLELQGIAAARSDFAADRFSAAVSLTGLLGDDGTVRVRLSHGGLRSGALATGLPDVDPMLESLDLDIVLEKLPFDWWAWEQYTGSDSDRILAGLVAAGSTLAVTLDHASPMLRASGNGRFSPLPDEKSPVTGEFHLVIAGLDDLTARLREAVFAGDDRLQGHALWAGILQIAGQKVTDAGDTVHRYHVEVLPDSRILLNGNDIEALLRLVAE